MPQDRFLGIFEALMAEYGFQYYRFSLRKMTDLSLTGSILAQRIPEGWPAAYHSKKYGEVDPVKRNLGLSQKPFRWRDVVNLPPQATHRKRAAKLFQDAARFGLREGYAFPIHGRNGLVGGVFIGGEGCLFSTSELLIVDAAMRASFWRLLDYSGHAKELLAPPDLSIAQVTRRELDILTLLAQGSTSPEIGKTLKISSHTVDWYINGIQRRFDAKNRQHVVALAFRYGLIT